ncbi:hypothetical protein CEE37_00635 [candidate division LCP-89 bacterium B3_LCP]|uniref:Secretion system C-terminal sorting domain-containing protein n=1 Tax=candidate division LCP-89 bacterium B3_LCP TaxID=2012998 RepID=A0A532V4T9_UNCL8|nr:MAG: hypothetical protein CEE37_00635 [candidate division LCP-89 bacterium B3_LCP]
MKVPITILISIMVATGVYCADDWTQVFPPEPLPIERWGHAMAYIGEDQVLMFSGEISGAYNNETWLYDLSDNTWTNMDPEGTVPAPLRDHDMAYIGGDQVLLFAGYEFLQGPIGDTWLYTLSTNSWTYMIPSSGSPPVRYSHVMCYIGDDQVFVHGGANNSGYLGDSWIYDLSQNTWTEVTPVGVNPEARHYHGIARLGTEQALIFGGLKESGGYINDTWLYDKITNTWTNMQPIEPIPHQRRTHAMSYLGDDQVILFGGEYLSGFYEDTWVYNVSENAWSLDSNSVTPGLRARHRMCETDVGGSSYIVMFGGWLDGNNDNQTWTFGGGDYLGIQEPVADIVSPFRSQLSQNFPNPFNPITTINFDLPVASLVKLDVFDINGRNVGAFRETPKSYTPGTHQITFDGTGLPSGIYIYRLTAGDFTGIEKMVLMK